MTRRSLVFLSVAASLAVSPASPADSASTAPPAAASTPRMSWGAPDLTGIWDFRTITPLERPEELEGKEVLADREAAAYQKKRRKDRNNDQRPEKSRRRRQARLQRLLAGLWRQPYRG